MSVYKYTDEANDFLPSFDPGSALYQMIFTHDGYPDMCYNAIQNFARFLELTAAHGNPPNFAALRQAGALLQYTKVVAPNPLGYVGNRLVFYVAGDPNNFLHLFEEFLVFLEQEKDLRGELRFPGGLSLIVEPHMDVDLGAYRAAEKILDGVEVREPALALPHEVFLVNPPNGLSCC